MFVRRGLMAEGTQGTCVSGLFCGNVWVDSTVGFSHTEQTGICLNWLDKLYVEAEGFQAVAKIDWGKLSYAEFNEIVGKPSKKFHFNLISLPENVLY